MAVSFDTDWDVEKYKDDTEPSKLWKLRELFMILHKDKFPEEYLVGLARAFINVEFLGCTYPPEVMERIAELSKDVKINRSDVQRTLVSATVAVRNKNKGRGKGNKS